MSNTYGYARVSTSEQDLTIQREALLRAGCKLVREEKRSGTKLEGRAELDLLMKFMNRGDTLMVTKIDRLARTLLDMQTIVHELELRWIAQKAKDQPIDTGTAAGKAFLGMLGVFAEFETNIRRERQMEGVKKAKADGVYKGRKPSIDRERLAGLRSQGLNPTQIAKAMGIDRTSVYRLLAEDGKVVA